LLRGGVWGEFGVAEGGTLTESEAFRASVKPVTWFTEMTGHMVYTFSLISEWFVSPFPLEPADAHPV
jgi:hypothetical protein